MSLKRYLASDERRIKEADWSGACAFMADNARCVSFSINIEGRGHAWIGDTHLLIVRSGLVHRYRIWNGARGYYETLRELESDGMFLHVLGSALTDLFAVHMRLKTGVDELAGVA